MKNTIADKNNNIIEIGDIVRISGSPIKNDNATYIVAQDGTSDFYSESGLTMYKVVKGKNGYSISRCKYNICFWPLVCFSSKYKYTRAELNTATIEILVKNDPSKIEIKMCADSWENPCEEGKEKDLYYRCTIETAEGKEIEDISFLCSQVEKLQQFLSNITLKTDETINIFKACNTDFYYKRTSYEAIYTADTKETTEEETTTEVETVTEQEEATQETEREETRIIKFEANYTSVNESTARTAKMLNSFSDYKSGSATAEQKHYTDAIVNYANELLEKNPTNDTDKLEKVQYYIDLYSKKVAAAIDKSNRIDSMCPSIMISGGSNFPVRKKEKQVSAMENHYEETKYLYNTDESNYYFKKIRTTLTDSGIIRSDDKNAVQMIKNKIARLEAEPDTYGNKKAEIRRLKGRLLQLAPEETKKDIEITINGKEATFENIIAIFNESLPQKSRFSEDEEHYYLNIPLWFSNGKRKYNEYLSNEVNADCTMLSTYGNRENGYKTIWKPLTNELKFMLIINKISGSGNKAVMYSILKDLIKKPVEQEEEVAEESEEDAPFKVVENTEIMRLQLLFDGIPEASTREILKKNGFRWSPSQKAWQRLLNDNALYSLKRVSEAIANIA